MRRELATISRVLLVATIAGAGLVHAGAIPETTKLDQLAQSAQTAAQHAEVARQYRVRAEMLESEAKKLRTDAEKAMVQQPISHKWPTMASASARQAQEQAVEAERASRQAEKLSVLHMNLAMEAGFGQ
jgi:hypothetical protein